jgi:glycyl-tRNA synthetase
VHPDEPVHSGYPGVVDLRLNLVPAEGDARTTTVETAVADGTICNEAMAYYMGRTHLFLLAAGVDPGRLRFRQHTPAEMAHYATDCWDAEVELTSGWTEVVGIADRSCYDLTAHQEYTGTEMKAVKKYAEPVRTKRTRLEPKMKVLGPLFKGDAGKVSAAMEALPLDEVEKLAAGGAPIDLEYVGPDGAPVRVQVPPEGYEVTEAEVVESGESYTPRVIEPSFGLDRVFYTVMEHRFNEYPETAGEGDAFAEKEEGEGEGSGEDEGDGGGGVYRVLSLPPSMAPVSFGVFPLIRKEQLTGKARDIFAALRSRGIAAYYDEGGTIGRRYARMDEIGTPYCITVDFDTEGTGKVTVRDRDTCAQARVDVEGLEDVAEGLMSGRLAFEGLL